MALIAGDVLQNLRSTLDHLAWALVETNGGKPTRVIAETASATRQAEAQRDLEIKKAEYAEQSRRQQASADKAYELQTNVMLQQVTAEQVKVQQVEKEGQIKVQEAEILRHEKELIATVLKGAKIERQRIENMAAAEKNR
jgi:flotillin